MAGSTWRRKRDRRRSDSEGGRNEVISASARTEGFATSPHGTRPTQNGPAGAPNPSVSDAAASTDDAADAYSAWAERLRQKRMNAQETIKSSAAPIDGVQPPGANWRTENLFAETERVDTSGQSARRDPVELSAAYAVLDLDAGADLEAVDAQYRRLAKRHHPDRFIDADDATRREHAESFRSISTARDVIRQINTGI